MLVQVLKEHTGTISIKELSAKTSIKPEDIRNTLEEHLNLIQMQKSQKVICADPYVIEKCAPFLCTLLRGSTATVKAFVCGGVRTKVVVGEFCGTLCVQKIDERNSESSLCAVTVIETWDDGCAGI